MIVRPRRTDLADFLRLEFLVPTTEQIIDLFRALSADDPKLARGVADDLCRAEAARGNHKVARRLKDALRSASAPSVKTGPTIAFAPSSVAPLQPYSQGLAGVRMPGRTRSELGQIVREWSRRELLKQNAIPRRSRLLLHGPPGCGKSLTARALAHELSLPAYVVRFDSIIGSYLGQTAVHLRQLFQFVESTPSLLLIDELDALGGTRGSLRDVGELDRIVIAMMQELEHCQPKGVIVATTNLPKRLDQALWRRFDVTLHLPQPTKLELRSYVEQLAAAYGVKLTTTFKRSVGGHGSYAAAERSLLDLMRQRLLQESV